jgi:class 3 adenylate cyclase/WD40 repeat protein
MFTDIEESVRLQQALGTERYATILQRHGELFYAAVSAAGASTVEKNTGDGFMVRFDGASDAVAAALRFQHALQRENWRAGEAVRVRIGIHEGELLVMPQGPETPDTVGTAVNLAARVMNLAMGGQTLLTRAVFDNARQFINEIPGVAADAQAPLRWIAHGAYLMKGIEEPVEIHEVGEKGRAPFRRPPDTASARRSVAADEEALLGWRPARRIEVPKRPGWVLERSLGQGGFGEVWLAQHRETCERRVFKFCFDAERLRSLKHELALFRYIRESLGVRPDIAALYDVQLETPPYFLESEYCAGGVLSDWFAEKSRAGGVPLAQRLGIVVRVARALAAAHSVGIIHKDVKPANIFIEERDGIVQPRLADFGIGVLVDRSRMQGLNVTITSGFTIPQDSSLTGTGIYLAPEYWSAENKPSIQGDIYSLGVLLYQLVVGDFARPIGIGWERQIDDPLLVEDITHCIDVDPGRRFASALQLAERLETLDARRAEKAAAAAAVERERQQQLAMEQARERQRKARIAAAVFVVIAGLLGVLAFVLNGARAAAVRHAAEIEKEREIAQARLYVADVQTVADDMPQRQLEAGREKLDRHRPAPGQRDLRGWEWFFADSLLHTATIERSVSRQPLRALAASPEGGEAAVAGDAGEVSVWSCDRLEKVRGWLAGAPVRALAWRHGILAAGLENGEVALWDASSGAVQKRWKAHDGAVAALAWHPAQPQLVTGGADGICSRWSRDGESLASFKLEAPTQAIDWRQDASELAVVFGTPARLISATPDALDTAHRFDLGYDQSALAWRPGAHEVAVAMNGAPLRSWNSETGDDAFWLPAHFTGGATAYAWSPKGDYVAVGSVDGKILLIDPANFSESRVALYGHKSRVPALHWLGGERERLLSAGDDGRLCAWDDLRRSPEISSIKLPGVLAGAHWHPGERKFAVLVAGDEVHLVDGGSLQTVWSAPLPPCKNARAPLRGASIEWSPDGRRLAAACSGRPLAIWHFDAPARFTTIEEADDLSAMQWSADSRELLLRGAGGWSRLAVEGGARTPIPDTANADWIVEAGSGRIGILTDETGEWRYRIAASGDAPARDVMLRADAGAMRTFALSRERTLLAIGGESGALSWLDLRTGRCWSAARAHAGPIIALGWHPDGDRIASTGVDGTCRIFNVAQGAQNWVIKHDMPNDIVANGWSADGRTLLVASSPAKRVKFYDASNSYLREKGEPAADRMLVPQSALGRALSSVEQNPGADFGWRMLAQEVRRLQATGATAQTDLLLAASELGIRAQFTLPREERPQAAEIVRNWQSEAIPPAVQIAEASAIERWEEVLKLCDSDRARSGSDAWFVMARAEALARLGQRAEAEAANLAARATMRRGVSEDLQGILTSAGDSPPRADGCVELGAWANARREDDWTGGKHNDLAALPDVLPQRGGFAFHPGDLIQLAGNSFRLSIGRMLPRSTPWIPLRVRSTQLSFLVATTYTDSDAQLREVCLGHLFLLRADGGGAVRIALIAGQNIWDWWTPPSGGVSEAPPEFVAWRGANDVTMQSNRGLALYRLDWDAAPGEQPVIAFCATSTVRGAAPMVVAVAIRKAGDSSEAGNQ